MPGTNAWNEVKGLLSRIHEHDPLVTGSVYIDLNGERTNPDIPKIDALLRVVTGNPSEADTTTAAAEDNPDDLGHRQREVPVISYSIRGQAALMNSWEDPNYFTGAFPTLFPKGLGGHRDQRPKAVSLSAFA